MKTELNTDKRLNQAGSRYQLNTPALIIDLDSLERNIAYMASYLHQTGRKIRPHAKSHKCIKIAEAQIKAGAVGVCCATLDEAEVMSTGNVSGILITSPITSPIKIQRLIKLISKNPDTMIVVDNQQNISALAEAAEIANISINVLIDIDLGFARTGAVSADAAEALARHISTYKSLNFMGIQAYGGHLQHIQDFEKRLQSSRQVHKYIEEVVDRLISINMPPAIVTGGGTGTHAIDTQEGPFTEIQAGSYIFMDAEYNDVGNQDNLKWPFEQSLFVQTTVISQNHTNMATTDAGTKAFALNGPLPRIVTDGYKTLSYEYAGDEHGKIKAENDDRLPALGEAIECVVSHCDPTVALYDIYHCVRKDRLIDIWPIDARGRRF